MGDVDYQGDQYKLEDQAKENHSQLLVWEVSCMNFFRKHLKKSMEINIVSHVVVSGMSHDLNNSIHLCSIQQYVLNVNVYHARVNKTGYY